MDEKTYGLTKPSFQLDPQFDSNIFVGRDDVKSRLNDRLKRSMPTKSAMHTMIYGDYGSGKTHTLNYIAGFLSEQKLDILPIFVGSPRIDMKSDPSDLYRSIIQAMSISNIFSVFVKVFDSVQHKINETQDLYKRVDAIDEVVKNRDLSSVLYKYTTSRPAEDFLVAKWLSGEKLSAKEKGTLQVMKDNSDPNTAIQTLKSLLTLFKTISRKYVLLLLDEMEKLVDLPLRRQNDFQDFLRQLVGQDTYVSVIIAFSIAGGGLEQTIPMYQPTSPVGTRVGYPQNYIELKEFDDPERMKTFVRELIAALRDPKADIENLVKKAKSLTEEKIGDFFPFTDDAVELIFQRSTQGRIRKLLLPRDLQITMTACLGDAIIRNKSLVDTEIVERVMAQE